MNRTLYSLLFYLALPVIALRLLLRSRKAPLYRQRLGERFAWSLPAMRPDGIWVHAVSVGESIAAAPMVRALLERYPDVPVTVTCMTPTGSERIRALFGERVQHCYLPYDVPCAAARFLDRLSPRLAVIMETELWPNYIHQCGQRGVPVVLANARLSARSARGYGRLRGVTQPMLAALDWIAVQTSTEAERFCALGARNEHVSVTGSIKFDLALPPDLPVRAAALRQTWGNRPVWIAASTHAGEDEILLNVHRRVREQSPNALLILVPRHPERFDEVFTLCQRKGFETRRRSREQAVSPDTAVYLGDTMGELLFLYALADLAFVGGSLIERGGHNLLEPAALGKPVLSGPHLFNFLDIAAQLREAGALQDVSNAETLASAVLDLFQDEPRAEKMRQGGLSVLKANQGALERLLTGLDALFKKSF
ncbi:3-deoxy-D-manno-octulosonic-acid transferase [Pseudomonas duriflava]|uniref:3-deoxy-D-manno-octulosonic acid transferase n=1 Tax=Pseudomonas duriflava TaxID=459528 RepID=A0A562QBT3_9PSED|nr:lipid IV(A) 3-deoxy-D-manno-octulosonic acid transferase [Pseudomonas duriflava]TWI54217.1 3-deoxy-D-manno-octulosonic-acid transferase [Pseudomonas duriflava]